MLLVALLLSTLLSQFETSKCLFSFELGNLTLFNIPLLGAPATDAPQALSSETITNIDPNILEDARLRTPQLIRKYGYPAEVHHTVTSDGYILELHRIARPGAQPVLLTHGLMDSSATWIMMGPDKSLAYMLYDLGYDVWLANMRGNTYARKHTKYTTNHAIFWNFSFHEMGVHDLPATIDYILGETNHKQLHYIGHSQGTTVFWIMASERPEYMAKIKLMQAMAPVAFLKHCKSPVVEFLSLFQDPLSLLLKLIGANEFLPSNDFTRMFSQIICDEATITKELCSNVMFLVAGYDFSQLNETMVPVILGHSPAGASTKQMQHFGQLKRSGEFRQFDYGWMRNHWRYNSITPPPYKLENVKCKVALYYGKNDWLAAVQDVEHLIGMLPNVIEKSLIDYQSWNHLDFIWGTKAKEMLWEQIIKQMREADAE